MLQLNFTTGEIAAKNKSKILETSESFLSFDLLVEDEYSNASKLVKVEIDVLKEKHNLFEFIPDDLSYLSSTVREDLRPGSLLLKVE